MGFFRKIFAKKDNDDRPPVANGPDDDAIIAYDNEGKQFAINKEEYRKSVLPNKFREVINDPDKLYDALVITLSDGFFEECLAPAKRLAELEKNSERGTAILGIALMKNGRFAEAKSILQDFLRQHGNSGIILTNLAKVQAEEGDTEGSYKTLWRALTIDPNQQNGLQWFAAIEQDKKGEDGFYEAMERVSEISGSWRSQLWLARRFLENKKIDSAIELYSRVLDFDGLPHDVYMMISGDLGNGGYLVQMVDLLLPLYDAEKHGAMAGINLMQALHKLGDKRRALEICEALEKLKRPDIMQYLKERRSELENDLI